MAPVTPKIQHRLRIVFGEDIAIGPGKVDLLEAIDAAGSITAAAKKLGMSYRRAWLLVDTMNRCFAAQLVVAGSGGRRGGGAELTPAGREVALRYRAMQAKAAAAAAADLEAITRLLA
jgi:molybdate transport system regulatory protein